jgi:tryptophanyl-tRNA synthetase
MNKPVILTGLRANNDLHIGNYFGALLPIIDMAKNRSSDYQINLFIPDLHSFTTPIDHTKLQAQIRDSLKMFVAAGLPLADSNIYMYAQSRIHAHSELTVILNSFTGVGEMNRMTQYKDKSTQIGSDRVSVGLFDYPVLMAADILLYGAIYIPVGDDQTQHLEFTRDIAERMNNKFGDLFTVPKPVKEQNKFFGKDQGLRVRDLADPTKKMSKSADSEKGVIFMGDKPDEARKKVLSAATDSVGKINYDYAKQPGISNLLDIYKLLGGEAQQYIGQKQYGPFKENVANKISEFLSDFNTKLSQVDENALLNKLQSSEIAMNKQANETLSKVQKAVGLR